jgi:hypothetical protein
MPGVQEPHCRPCISVNPCCTEHAIDLQSLDGADLVAGRRGGQVSAGLGRKAVHQNDAGAAVRGVTAPMGSGQPQLVAQEMDEQHARLDIARVLLAVDGNGQLHHAASRSARATARRSTRSVSTPAT